MRRAGPPRLASAAAAAALTLMAATGAARSQDRAPPACRITDLAVSADANVLAKACLDGTIRVEDALGGGRVTVIVASDLGPVLRLALSGDGRRVAAVVGAGPGDPDARLRIWDAKSGAPAAGPIKPAGASFALSARGDLIAWADPAITAQTHAGLALKRIDPAGAGDRVALLAGAGRLVLVTVRGVDVALDEVAAPAMIPSVTWQVHPDFAVLAHGAEPLLVYGGERRLFIVNLGSGQAWEAPLSPAYGPLMGAAASGDGRRIAVLQAASVMTIDPATRRLTPLATLPGLARIAAFDAAGRLYVVTDDLQLLRLSSDGRVEATSPTDAVPDRIVVGERAVALVDPLAAFSYGRDDALLANELADLRLGDAHAVHLLDPRALAPLRCETDLAGGCREHQMRAAYAQALLSGDPPTIIRTGGSIIQSLNEKPGEPRSIVADSVRIRVGEALVRQTDYDPAERMLEAVLADDKPVLRARARLGLSLALRAEGHPEAARGAAAQGLSELAGVHGQDLASGEVQKAFVDLEESQASAMLGLGEAGLAEQRLKQAIEDQTSGAHMGLNGVELARLYALEALAAERTGDLDAAGPAAARALALLRSHENDGLINDRPTPLQLAAGLEALAQIRLVRATTDGDAAAETLLVEAVDRLAASEPDGAEPTLDARLALARVQIERRAKPAAGRQALEPALAAVRYSRNAADPLQPANDRFRLYRGAYQLEVEGLWLGQSQPDAAPPATAVQAAAAPAIVGLSFDSTGGLVTEDADGRRRLWRDETHPEALAPAQRPAVGAPPARAQGFLSYAPYTDGSFYAVTSAAPWSLCKHRSSGEVLKCGPDLVVKVAVGRGEIVAAVIGQTAWLYRGGDLDHGVRAAGLTSTVSVLELSPDGAWLVAGDDKGGLVVVSTVDGAAHPVIEGHDARIVAAAFSPTAPILATASAGGEVKLWSLQTFKRCATLGEAGASCLGGDVAPK